MALKQISLFQAFELAEKHPEFKVGRIYGSKKFDDVVLL